MIFRKISIIGSQEHVIRSGHEVDLRSNLTPTCEGPGGPTLCVMAKLLYVMPLSLDGYIEDEGGSFDWSVPSEEFLTFINGLLRPIGTILYGRRMYETMAIWETPEALPNPNTSVELDFARIWQNSEKIVYSRSLESVSTPNTRLAREFDPEAVRELKTRSPHDLSVSGPTLAKHAFRAGLVDEVHLFVVPFILGGGKRALPDVRLKLELADEHRFADGWVYLRYLVKN